jgi:hypothetical protein
VADIAKVDSMTAESRNNLMDEMCKLAAGPAVQAKLDRIATVMSVVMLPLRTLRILIANLASNHLVKQLLLGLGIMARRAFFCTSGDRLQICSSSAGSLA